VQDIKVKWSNEGGQNAPIQHGVFQNVVLKNTTV
jgi:hypothetical protein